MARCDEPLSASFARCSLESPTRPPFRYRFVEVDPDEDAVDPTVAHSTPVLKYTRYEGEIKKEPLSLIDHYNGATLLSSLSPEHRVGSTYQKVTFHDNVLELFDGGKSVGKFRVDRSCIQRILCNMRFYITGFSCTPLSD
eukprot:tig00000492_g1549.t1